MEQHDSSSMCWTGSSAWRSTALHMSSTPATG